MSDQIVSIDDIQRRAQKAFAEGVPMSGCPFPWSSAAYRTWMEEYKRLVDTSRANSPGSHGLAINARQL